MYEVKWMPKTAAELEELCNKALEHGFRLVACNEKFCVFESAQLERAADLATACENKHDLYIQYGCVFCPDCDKSLGG